MTYGNDPAFSRAEVPAEGRYEGSVSQIGLTKREWFAGMAMSGVSSSTSNGVWNPQDGPRVAEISLALADALIAALNQKPEEGK